MLLVQGHTLRTTEINSMLRGLRREKSLFRHTEAVWNVIVGGEGKEHDS